MIKIDEKEMLKKGVHVGHHRSRLHPKMLPFILGIKNNIHIFDLKKTKEKLKEALNFLKLSARERKVILIIGTDVWAKKIVEKIGKELKVPYVSERWLGGLLTNFKVISKKLETYKEFLKKEKEKVFEKYPKKERLKIYRKLEKMKKKYEGIKELATLPEIIFLCNPKKEESALKEARAKGIKVVAICDTDCDPSLIDWPIPASNNSLSALEYILEKVKEAIEEGRKKK